MGDGLIGLTAGLGFIGFRAYSLRCFFFFMG